MSHGVDDVIYTDADAERRILLGIFGIVGVLPGIAQIHVMADRHHDPALVVINAPPVRIESILLINAVRVNELLAGTW